MKIQLKSQKDEYNHKKANKITKNIKKSSKSVANLKLHDIINYRQEKEW